jgi:predicted nucleic acid-binding protein
MSVIANTTIISNFASLEALNLLRHCWPDLHISEQVFTEIQAGLEQGYTFYAGVDQLLFPLAKDGWLKLTSMQTEAERIQYGNLLGKLHHGEASCLAIAHERKWTFLTDDKTARAAGKRLQIPISGTLGSLVRLIKQEQLSFDEAENMLKTLTANGYYAPVNSLKEIDF